jgi:hypothetical protein
MSWYFSPHFYGISVAYHCLLLSIITEPFPDLHYCKGTPFRDFRDSEHVLI